MTESTERLSSALADRYRILRRLGEGGMATVYLAEDLKHKRQVAVKVLKPELAAVLGAERFVQEITTTASLQHPHILPLFDSGEADSFLYYVMPYIEGETLRDKLDRETQLGIDESVKIATEVADALDYAHRHGIIHRDIKPENILLHDGRPMVADFGIALAVSAAAGGRMTETGLSLGTPHYMSPEQATAEKEISARSDVYSLGSVLYEMLAGEPPHLGNSAQQIIMKIIADEARPVTELRKSVPVNVAAAVAQSLEKLPADRFGSAAEFGAALTDRHFTTVSGADLHSPPGRHHRLVNRMLIASVVGLAVLAAWGWARGRWNKAGTVAWNYVTLGNDLQPMPGNPALALSPDGTMLVIRDDQPGGLLWLKRRDQLDPVPIAGTEGAMVPVFSPDGQWVAYVAGQQLKKVRPDGGASVTVADSAGGGNGYGGPAWLDDGTIVYTNPGLTELRRVGATGGASSLVLDDTLLGGGGIGHPEALPGARGVLFQYCLSGCVSLSIHVLDLKTGMRRLLLDDVVQAWYLPTGRLLYVRRDGVALVAPFDLDRLEITGEGIPVLENVATIAANGFAPLTWSPSGSMVYLSGEGTLDELSAIHVDRDGAITPIDDTWAGAFNSLSPSPDGTQLAMSVGFGSRIDIWIKDLDGPFTRLSFGKSDRRPAWSPDGRLVAFIRDSVAGSGGMVYARLADGTGGDTLLAHIDRLVQEIAWSPDGDWLVLRTDNTTAGSGDLVGIPLAAGGDPVPLVATRFTELHPAVSPDGKWLAYTSDESGAAEVYVRPFPNTAAGRRQVSNGGGSQPVWSASGDELFYLDGNATLMAAPVRGGAVFRTDTPRPLFNTAGLVNDAFHQVYSALPDGSGFLFLSSGAVTAATGSARIVWLDDWQEAFAARMGN